MLMSFADAEEKKVSRSFRVLQYRTVCKDAGMAVAKLTGRYPEKGTAMNLGCMMVCYILNGSLSASIGKENIEAGEGDCLVIPPKERYFIEGQARFAMLSSPAWNPGQHREFDE